MGSVYEATSHARKREVRKSMSSHHSVGAVNSRSMNNREASIKSGTHVSNDDDK
jgi:hypothetical protein